MRKEESGIVKWQDSRLVHTILYREVPINMFEDDGKVYVEAVSLVKGVGVSLPDRLKLAVFDPHAVSLEKFNVWICSVEAESSKLGQYHRECYKVLSRYWYGDKHKDIEWHNESYENYVVRAVIDADRKPWFSIREMCKILHIKNGILALAEMPDKFKKLVAFELWDRYVEYREYIDVDGVSYLEEYTSTSRLECLIHWIEWGFMPNIPALFYKESVKECEDILAGSEFAVQAVKMSDDTKTDILIRYCEMRKVPFSLVMNHPHIVKSNTKSTINVLKTQE